MSGTRHRLVGLIAGTLAVLGAVSPGLAQTPSPADGPWVGWAQCVLIARGGNYVDEQVHTWRINGGPPRVTGSVRHWPGVWTVEGHGSRGAETWTVVVPETSAEIAIWEIPVTNNVRIASQHSLLVSPGAVRVSSASGPAGNFTLQEASFPAAEGPKMGSTIAGTRTRETPNGPGWRKPFEVLTQETCTWNFTRGTTVSNPPTPSIASATGTASAARPAESGRLERSASGAVVSASPTPSTSTIAVGSPTSPAPTPPSTTPNTSPSSSPRSSAPTRTRPTFVPPAPPASPSARLVVTGPAGSIPAGNVFIVRVEARMADGTVDTAFHGQITLAAAAPGGSNFSIPFSANATAGTVTFHVFLNDAANGYTITASAAGFASGTSATFNVTARP